MVDIETGLARDHRRGCHRDVATLIRRAELPRRFTGVVFDIHRPARYTRWLLVPPCPNSAIRTLLTREVGDCLDPRSIVLTIIPAPAVKRYRHLLGARSVGEGPDSSATFSRGINSCHPHTTSPVQPDQLPA